MTSSSPEESPGDGPTGANPSDAPEPQGGGAHRLAHTMSGRAEPTVPFSTTRHWPDPLPAANVRSEAADEEPAAPGPWAADFPPETMPEQSAHHARENGPPTDFEPLPVGEMESVSMAPESEAGSEAESLPALAPAPAEEDQTPSAESVSREEEFRADAPENLLDVAPGAGAESLSETLESPHAFEADPGALSEADPAGPSRFQQEVEAASTVDAREPANSGPRATDESHERTQSIEEGGPPLETPFVAEPADLPTSDPMPTTFISDEEVAGSVDAGPDVAAPAPGVGEGFGGEIVSASGGDGGEDSSPAAPAIQSVTESTPEASTTDEAEAYFAAAPLTLAPLEGEASEGAGPTAEAAPLSAEAAPPAAGSEFASPFDTEDSRDIGPEATPHSATAPLETGEFITPDALTETEGLAPTALAESLPSADAAGFTPALDSEGSDFEAPAVPAADPDLLVAPPAPGSEIMAGPAPDVAPPTLSTEIAADQAADAAAAQAGPETVPGPVFEPAEAPPAPVVAQIIPPTRQRQKKDFRAAIFFLAPGFLGFLLFVAFPLGLGLAMAFTNWSADPAQPRRFVGLANFARLWNDPKFWFAFANTGYFMLGLPVGIALSLLLAMALAQPINVKRFKTRLLLALLVIALAALLLALGRLGFPAPAGGQGVWNAATAGLPGWLLVLVGLTLGLGLLAVFGGAGAFRTLFYLPAITGGVATLLLWKNLFRAGGGVVDESIGAGLGAMTAAAARVPWWAFYNAAAVFAVLVAVAAARLWKRIVRGDFDRAELALGLAAALAAVFFAQHKLQGQTGLWFVALPLAVAGVGLAGMFLQSLAGLQPRRAGDSFFAALLGYGVLAFVLCLAGAFFLAWSNLPAGGVRPPQWLDSTRNLLGLAGEGGRLTLDGKNFGLGARDAILLVGLWAGVGGSTTLLYLAGLANVPRELYDAADVDGAGRWDKFWNVTWPQLAPTTFFVAVTACVAGLQGGFEQARVMTQGGPADTTTTLSYYAYRQAFEESQFGYASAVSLCLFLVVLGVTLANWRFGRRAADE